MGVVTDKFSSKRAADREEQYNYGLQWLPDIRD
jgi:hypothetical protein